MGDSKEKRVDLAFLLIEISRILRHTSNSELCPLVLVIWVGIALTPREKIRSQN